MANNLLQTDTSSSSDSINSAFENNQTVKTEIKESIQLILNQETIDIIELTKLSWQGHKCPLTRAQIWRLILGYENPVRQIRSEDLQQKRLEYLEKLKTLESCSKKKKPTKTLLKSFPKNDLFKNKIVQKSLSQLLDLLEKDKKLKKKSTSAMVIPFFIVFLSEYYPVDLETLEVYDEGPQKSYISIVEADTFWCTTIFLELFLHNKRSQLCENVKKALEKFDSAVFFHMNVEGVRMSFLNRWLKYLFLKDFPIHICLRIFDELIANKSSQKLLKKYTDYMPQNNFIVCLACALFSIFRNQILMNNGSQLEEIMTKLPTESWGEIEILILVSQAYLYQTILE